VGCSKSTPKKYAPHGERLSIAGFHSFQSYIAHFPQKSKPYSITKLYFGEACRPNGDDG
jgi:hypothetical protein